MKRYVVIPTTGRDVLQECLDAIQTQVDEIIVISHRAGVGITPLRPISVHIFCYNTEIPNISEMWNMGLEEAQRLAGDEPFHVAIINDDAIVPPFWFRDLVEWMTRTNTVLGSVDQFGMLGESHPLTFTESREIDLMIRMSGFAFILNGAKGLRLDEQFQWWYGDDDLEWTARAAGGVVRAPGEPVDHRSPGGSTVGQLAIIAGEDRQRFIDKWGKAPW